MSEQIRMSGTTQPSRRRLFTLAVVATAIGALTACSSSSAQPGDSALTGSNLTKSPIVIGMENASSGTPDGPQDAANVPIAKAWESWVNAEMGGINGHPVKIVFGDTKDDTATGESIAQTMIRSDHVVAEVGGTDSITSSVWIKTFNDAKVPVIGGQIPDLKTITSNPYFFSLDIPASNVAPLMLDTAKVAGAKSFSAVLCAESAACTAASQLWKPRAAKIGITWDGFTQVRASDPNYTAACVNLKDSGTQFVELAVVAPVALRVVQDCHRQGYQPSLYGVSLGSFDAKRLVPASKQGASFLGVVGGFPWYLNTPAISQYRAAMAKFGRNAYYENTTQSATWASLEMFRKAMANASSSPTAAEVAQAMWQIKDEDLDGLLPQKVTYTRGQASTPLNCLWSVQLANGVFSGGHTQCLTS